MGGATREYGRAEREPRRKMRELREVAGLAEDRS